MVSKTRQPLADDVRKTAEALRRVGPQETRSPACARDGSARPQSTRDLPQQAVSKTADNACPLASLLVSLSASSPCPDVVGGGGGYRAPTGEDNCQVGNPALKLGKPLAKRHRRI